jgi:hypothetical protein
MLRLLGTGALLACVGCASTPSGHAVAPRDGPEHVATTAVLTTVGGGLTTAGTAMLVCAGGGLGCFSGASYPRWSHGPKIEQVVLATSGVVVFAAGATALIMVPIWLAISGSDKSVTSARR